MNFSAQISFETVFTYALIALLSFLMTKAGMFDLNLSKKLYRFAETVTLPILMIYAFQVKCNKSNLAILGAVLIASAIIHIASSAVAHICYMKNQHKVRKTSKYSFVFGDYSGIGLPLLYAFGGNQGLFCGACYMLVAHVYSTLYGDFVLKAGTKRKYNPLAFVAHPLTFGFALGLLLFFTGIDLPAFADSAIYGIGTLTYPLLMIVLGAFAAQIPVLDMLFRFETYFYCGMKLLLFPFAVLIICLIFKLDDGITYIYTLMAALPCCCDIYDKSTKHGGTPQLAASLAAVSHILAAATIPLVMFIAKILLK